MRDRTTEYAKLIVSGKKICGRAEYQACKRHLDDMDDKGFPYIFDAHEAEYHIDLANQMTIGEGMSTAKLKTRGFQNFIIGSLFGWRARTANPPSRASCATTSRRFPGISTAVYSARRRSKTRQTSSGRRSRSSSARIPTLTRCIKYASTITRYALL